METRNDYFIALLWCLYNSLHFDIRIIIDRLLSKLSHTLPEMSLHRCFVHGNGGWGPVWSVSSGGHRSRLTGRLSDRGAMRVRSLLPRRRVHRNDLRLHVRGLSRGNGGKRNSQWLWTYPCTLRTFPMLWWHHVFGYQWWVPMWCMPTRNDRKWDQVWMSSYWMCGQYLFSGSGVCGFCCGIPVWLLSGRVQRKRKSLHRYRRGSRSRDATTHNLFSNDMTFLCINSCFIFPSVGYSTPAARCRHASILPPDSSVRTVLLDFQEVTYLVSALKA